MNTEALTGALQHAWSGFEGYLLAHPPFAPVIAAFLGPTLAFLLSQWATNRQLSTETRKQAEGVRKMIELEIQHNLELLNLLYKRFNDKELQPFPVFYAKVFESQILSLPTALDETEIAGVFKFYNRLDTLGKIQRKLIESIKEWTDAQSLAEQAIAKEKEAGIKQQPETRVRIQEESAKYKIYKKVVELFEQHLEEIIKTENPLQQKRATKHLFAKPKAYTSASSTISSERCNEDFIDISPIAVSDLPEQDYSEAYEAYLAYERENELYEAYRMAEEENE